MATSAVRVGWTIRSYFWRHDVHTAADGEDAARALAFTDRFRPERMRGLGEGKISWGGHQHNRLYLNLGGKGFRELGYLFGVAHEADCRSVVAADLDADGRQDLVLVEQRRTYGDQGIAHQVLRIQRNIAPGGNHWLGVRLRGAPGVPVQGGRVRVFGAFGVMERVMVTGDSFLAQHPAVATFGLGLHQKVERLEVLWPDGSRSVRKDVEVDGYHVVRPPR